MFWEGYDFSRAVGNLNKDGFEPLRAIAARFLGVVSFLQFST